MVFHRGNKNVDSYFKSLAVCPLLLDLDVLNTGDGGVQQVLWVLLVDEKCMLVIC